MNRIHYFGIRHHGPGSARRLLTALDTLQPSVVLIEGPADLTPLLPLLAHPEMQLPVALMSFVNDSQGACVYYPFAEYSPEYQAICWAVRHQAELRFIDVPVAVKLAEMLTAADTDNQEPEPSDQPPAELRQDPLATLASLAGYEEGESWWNQVLEQGCDDDPALFATVADMMSALRQAYPDEPQRDLMREAYMRQQIAEASKLHEGPLAVICGAWHVPALTASFSKKADKILLGQLAPKLSSKRLSSTWIPWTSARLTFASGYGAGVTAPQWYQHLWRYGNQQDSLVHWLTLIASKLRAKDFAVSTASVIEATLLCQSLANVRSKAAAGFEEARDAAIACLCFGNTVLWQQIETELLQGDVVGVVPADVPLAPLLDDLQQWQKQTRLKASALPTELSLDLRSSAGLSKSVLLRRLQLLDVPWGEPIAAGTSRGTFRERWTLVWQPEFAVQLVEHQVFGSTIAEAASNRTLHQLQTEKRLATLADLVLTCLEAQLPDVAAQGINRLAERAAQASDCIELLDALPSLVDISRYGTSREMTLEHLTELVQQLAVQAALALPMAVRQLNNDESERYRQALLRAHQQLELGQCPEDLMQTWWQSLETVCHSDGCDAGVRGLTARVLYQAEQQSAAQIQQLLARLLSAALPLEQSKRFFEGFFSGASEQLLYDTNLRSLTNDWLMALEPDSFIETLPLLRRVFSPLDAMERRRLLDTALQSTTEQSAAVAEPQFINQLPAQLAAIARLMQGDPQWMN